MKKEEKPEKRKSDWELADTRPPVIHAGHMENRVEHTFVSKTVDKPQETGI